MTKRSAVTLIRSFSTLGWNPQGPMDLWHSTISYCLLQYWNEVKSWWTLRNSPLLLSLTAETVLENIPCSSLPICHVFHYINEKQLLTTNRSMHTQSLKCVHPASLSTRLIAQCGVIPYPLEYPLGQLRSAVPPSKPLCLCLVGWDETQKRCWLGASAAPQLL